jgi:Leucine-rich repeat (LRR) protein
VNALRCVCGLLGVMFVICLNVAAQVSIPDASLEVALRRALNKPSGAILSADLAGLQQLTAVNPAKNGRLNGYHVAGATVLNVSGFTVLIDGSTVRIAGDSTTYSLVSHAANLATITIFPGLSATIPGTASGTQIIIGGVSPAGIVDLTGIGYCTNLRILDLTGNSISNLTPLVGMPNLTHIFLTDNQVVDLNPLANITTLRGISLANNKVVNLTPLTNLTNLTKLDLWKNMIVDITPLAGLLNLIWLDLRENQVSDTTALTTLVNLTGLALDNNPVGNAGLAKLAVLTKLTRLAINFTQISSLVGTQSLVNLHMLAAGGNTIRDFSRLVNNPGIGNGDYVFLGTVLGPPIDCASIALLRGRGVIVDDLDACQPAPPRNTDRDGDGLSDYDEALHYADPTNFDTDGDGMSDGWEVKYGLNPIDPRDANWDPDGDGLTNLQEYFLQSNPNDPMVISSITATPSSGVAPLGSSASLAVQVTGGNGALTYLWTKDGARITQTNVSGINGDTLSISAANAANEGLYRCTVTNSGGSAVYAERVLYVGALLSFVSQPASQKAYYGSDVSMHVAVTGGLGAKRYRWYREAAGVSTATGGNSNTLTLGHVYAADAAAYYCVVTDLRGSYTSNKATLSLAPRLVPVVSLPAERTVPAGSTYSLRVSTVGGFQPVVYDWQFNGYHVDPTHSYVNGSELVLTDFQVDHEGVYSVFILDGYTQSILQACTLTVGLAMPLAGLGGLIAAAGAMAAAGAALLRKRRR